MYDQDEIREEMKRRMEDVIATASAKENLLHLLFNAGVEVAARHVFKHAINDFFNAGRSDEGCYGGASALRSMASRLGCRPEDLFATIMHESADAPLRYGNEDRDRDKIPIALTAVHLFI